MHVATDVAGITPQVQRSSSSFFSLWFQDVPMLTLAILYAFTQTTCKLPERRDVTGVLRDVGISATASGVIAASYRLLRSTVRLIISVCVRIRR